MNAEELKIGAAKLESLSVEEYGLDLKRLMLHGDTDERFQRLLRLIGVTIKEPFADPVNLGCPSVGVGALRTWHLVDSRLHDQDLQKTWQHRTLEKLLNSGDLSRELGWVPPTAYELAINAHHERGFFGYLAISIRKYLCRDSKLRAEIESNLQEAKKSGFDVKTMAPEVVVSSIGLSLGTLLIQTVPVLSVVGAPVIAGLVLIIYNIGIDAFCSWANSREGEMAKAER